MDISHVGWLEKQGEGIVSFYRKRWFCLQGLRLFYYKQQPQQIQVSGLGQHVLSSNLQVPPENSNQNLTPPSINSAGADLHPRRATIGSASDSSSTIITRSEPIQPTGFVDLETIKRIDVIQDPQHPFLFRLVPQNERGRVWNLKASNEKDLKRWVEVLRPLCEREVVLPELLKALSSQDVVLQRDAIRLLYPFITTDRYPHVINQLLETVCTLQLGRPSGSGASSSSTTTSSTTTTSSSSSATSVTTPKDEFLRSIYYALTREVVVAVSSSKLIAHPYPDTEVVDNFINFLFNQLSARSFELQLSIVDSFHYLLSLDYEVYSSKLAPQWLKIFGLLVNCYSPSLEKRILIILSFLTSHADFVSSGLDIGKPELKHLLTILELTQDLEKASLILKLLIPLSHLDTIKTKLGSRSKLKILILFYNRTKDDQLKALVQALVDNLVTHKKVQKKFQTVCSKLGVESSNSLTATSLPGPPPSSSTTTSSTTSTTSPTSTAPSTTGAVVSTNNTTTTSNGSTTTTTTMTTTTGTGTTTTTGTTGPGIKKSAEELLLGTQTMYEAVHGVANPMESQLHPVLVSNLVIKHSFNERRFESFQECLIEKINRSFESASESLGVKFKLQSFRIAVPTLYDSTGWKIWFWFDKEDLLLIKFILNPDITLNLTVSSGVASVNLTVSQIHFEGMMQVGFDKPYVRTPSWLTFPSMPKFTCKLSLTKAFGLNVAHIFVCQVEKFIQTSMLSPTKFQFE